MARLSSDHYFSSPCPLCLCGEPSSGAKIVSPRPFWLRWFGREAPPAPGAAAPAPFTAPATPMDEAMMRRALDLAREAMKLGEVPVGAVVYRTATGEVVGEGFNRREIDHDPAAHAELLAIRQACGRLSDWRLNECSLAVTL